MSGAQELTISGGFGDEVDAQFAAVGFALAAFAMAIYDGDGQQELITEDEDSQLVIHNLLIKDYPIILTIPSGFQGRLLFA